MLGRWWPKLAVGAGLLLVLVGVGLGLVVLDVQRHENRVPRNVTLDGESISGTLLSEIQRMLSEQADRYAERPMHIDLGDGQISASYGAFGYELDVEATYAAIAAVGRTDGVWSSIEDWIERQRNPVDVTTRFTRDEGRARSLLEQAATTLITEPREPFISSDETGLVLDAGDAGRRLDVDATLVAVIAEGPAESVGGAWEPIPTEVGRGDAIALYTALKRPVDAGLFVFVLGQREYIDTATLASWVSAESVDGELEVSFDETAMSTLVNTAFETYVSGELAVAYDVVDGTPQVTEITDTRQICCDQDALVAQLTAHLAGERSGPLPLPVRPTTAAETEEGVDARGVVEVVAEFTTRHNCCESRVTNIHRIADLTRGVVILPGEQFSVNDFVGRRTRANGFVDGGVIIQGEFETDVGGGISQYATTLFNAAFFAGLDMPVYQSHSLYLPRYPYGREATLSYPEPDLVIHNTTPYAVLIWPTYDSRSITVTLYSTQYVVVTESGQDEEQWRQCTRITTRRTREYPDGTIVEDAVYAFYRPSAGYQCGELDPADDDS